MSRPDRTARGPAQMEQSAPVFDRATRLARALFGDVGAEITLVSEFGIWRSRGLSKSGNAIGVREVMRTGQLLWVEDAQEDVRFLTDPNVQGSPHMRFYSGAPIKLEDGTTPGALWVAGLEPRAFDPALAARLQDLADFVADEWARVNARKAQDTFARTMTAMVAAMPAPMVMTDRAMRVLYASPPWVEARGLEGRKVVGESLYDLRPDLFPAFREGFDHCLTGHPLKVERLQVSDLKGGSEWLRIELAPWYDPEGAVGGLVMSSHSITDVVEALELTERSEARLKFAMEIAELHVYEMDYVRRELVKVGAEDTFFDTPTTFEGLFENIWSRTDPRDLPNVMADWDRHLKDGAPYQPEYRVVRRDGREVWACGAAKLIRNETGKPIRLIGALRNITADKMAELALVRAKEEAEAANLAKSAFLATMSHEIRTPLNGVLGMAQAMAVDAGLTETQRERLEVIRQSGESLLAILNDVLDLSKIEAGKLELETAEFEVNALATTAHATFQAIAEAKGLSFELTVDRAARGVYAGDQVRVRQILWNLVANALKFTPSGGVKVRVGRTRSGISLTVADSGIGMSPDQLAGLFRKFEQADASTTRKFGGTGLGLAICRQLAELMGGAITTRSTPGEGSTFTVHLPLKKLARAAVKPKRAPKAHRRPRDTGRIRLLAAEDNTMNQLVLRTLLSQVGIDPVIVADGRQAVDAWERGPWDVILMDVQMPVMDGPSATAIIRARERAEGRPRTQIIALTANAMSHQVSEYLQSGMDGVVAKPIEAGRLFDAIETALERAQAARAAAYGRLVA